MNLSTNRNNSLVLQFSTLFIVWFCAQILFFYQFGIETGYEATKYISQAKHFLENGSYTTGPYLFYSVQILLLAFCIKTGVGYLFAVLVQLLFNALSVYCFYRLIQFLTRNTTYAFTGTLLFLLQFYYHLYNVYLFTESLFFSFSVIYVSFLFSLTNLNLKKWICILLFLFLLYFTRPTGVFFVPATALYVIFKFYRTQAAILLISFAIAAFLIFYFLLNYALGSGGEFDFLLPYQYEEIICGVPTVNIPHNLTVPGEENSVEGLWYILTHYFPLFIKLAVQRVILFFGATRSYYSWAHNFFLIAFFYPLYIFIIVGLKRLFSRYAPETIFVVTLTGLTTTTVALSCDEWHNRFLLALFPFLLLLTIVAAQSLFTRKQ